MNEPDPTIAAIAERYQSLLERITAAGGTAVSVVAVTKALGPWAIDAAARCGIARVGESYAQECAAKLSQVSAEPRPRLHFVGRLQRNKVRMLASLVDVWQTVDRPELVAEIARRSPGARVMIQVNVSGAPSQGGCAPATAEPLAEAASQAGLDLVGLMGIGPLASRQRVRACFRELRRMVDGLGLRHCSMGMTDDLEIAVAEGATMVRVGRSLFGERPRHGVASVPQWGRVAVDR